MSLGSISLYSSSLGKCILPQSVWLISQVEFGVVENCAEVYGICVCVSEHVVCLCSCLYFSPGSYEMSI